MVRSITVTTLQLRIHRVFRDLTYFTNSIMQTYIRSYYSLSWSFCSFHGTRRFHDNAHNIPDPVLNKYNPHPHVPSPESTRSLCSDYATGGRPAWPGDVLRPTDRLYVPPSLLFRPNRGSLSLGFRRPGFEAGPLISIYCRS